MTSGVNKKPKERNTRAREPQGKRGTRAEAAEDKKDVEGEKPLIKCS
jgi:hypothetical protein